MRPAGDQPGPEHPRSGGREGLEAADRHLPEGRGSGAVSFTALRHAKPDGYTIALATSSINVHKFLGTLDFGYEAFEPFIALNFDPGGISVKTDAPWKNLKEFIEHAKKNPGKVSVAASNPGRSPAWSFT